MTKQRLKIGIIGASGYSGGELIRLILNHDQIELAYATSTEFAGQSLAAAHRNLLNVVHLDFLPTPSPEQVDKLPKVDCVFLCLPHGKSLEFARALAALPDLKLIDLSGDFRLKDASDYRKYYHLEHTAMGLQGQFVYGLPEIFGGRIREARYIANPGCFATAAILGCAPLAQSGVSLGAVIIDAKTGSSGSGIKPTGSTHHPDRAESFYAYKAFQHQHLPEIVQALHEISGHAVGTAGEQKTHTNWLQDLTFQTHSVPMIRGIFASIYVQTSGMTVESLRELYAEFYKGTPFVRLVDGSPNPKWVNHSNYCDIGLAAKGNTAIVFVALDNLVKGAAGQALQNFNLMFGLSEKSGLTMLGGHP